MSRDPLPAAGEPERRDGGGSPAGTAAPRRRYAVVAAGGTGGHLIPALAISRALVERGHPPESIEMVGSRRGQESALLVGEGFPVTLLPGRGVSRRVDVRSLLDNLASLAALAWAVVSAVALLARWRPRVVVSVGGYASFAPAVAALVLRVPLVLVNIDAVPGLVHRLLGRFAAASAVAFPGTPLPKAVVTGTPVRPDLVALDRSDEATRKARAALGVPSARRTLAVFGGSLGARRINEAVSGLAERWRDRDELAIYHVTGRRDWEQFAGRSGRAAGARPDDSLFYRMVPYEARMGLVYAAADLLVCRAGAMTVAELAATGVPAVLVPLPGAPGDHQTANARALVAAGAAELLPDHDCDPEHLDEKVGALLADPDRLRRMSTSARSLGRPDAAARTAELVDSCAGVGSDG